MNERVIVWILAVGCGSEGEVWRRTEGLPPVEESLTAFEDSESSESSDYGYYDEDWRGQWGEISFRQDGAVREAYTGFVDWQGGVARCELAFVLTEEEPTEACPGCEVAWSFVLSELEIWTDEGGRCHELGWLEREGQELAVGHEAPDTLWERRDGEWSRAGGSDLSAQLWEFEIPM